MLLFSSIATPKARQVIASISSGLVMTMMMVIWGYPAAALPQMEAEGSNIHLSKEQSSWFATVTLMLSIPGSFVGASVYEWFGPRRTMLTLMPIMALSTSLMAVASLKTVQEQGYAETILLGTRIVQGSAVALLMPFSSVYTYEICDQKTRGMMSSFVEVWATLGYLLCYICGCLLSWVTISWLLPLAVLLPAFIGLLCSPESPLWLARKGRDDEAKKSLVLVRCTTDEVLLDLETVKCTILKENDGSNTLSERFLRTATKSNIKAILTSCLIFTMCILTGLSVITIYVVKILDAAGIGMDPRWSSVVVGSLRTLFSSIGCLMLHKMSRKFMLYIGNIFTCIGSVGLGIFFSLHKFGSDVSSLGWLPLLGLVVWMIGYAGAVGPVTWTASVEVLPGPVRSIGFGLGSTTFSTAAFATSKIFIDLQNLIGLHGVFFTFACSSLGFIIVTFVFLPETLGKSMLEIQDYWENNPKQKKDITYA